MTLGTSQQRPSPENLNVDHSTSISMSLHQNECEAKADVDQIRSALASVVNVYCDLISSHMRATEQLADEIARAIVLRGDGERFERAVAATIRNYCEARRDVLRFEHEQGLSNGLREDIVAGFRRVMETHRLEMKTLGVIIEEVSEGTKVDPTLHSVAGNQGSTALTAAEVEKCVTPIFHWTAVDGTNRMRPAEVIVATSGSPK